MKEAAESVRAEGNNNRGITGGAHRAQRLLDAGLVGVLYWSIDGGIVDANDTLLQMLGYTRDDLAAGRIDWIEMTPPELRERDQQPVADLHAMGRHLPFEKEYVRKDGTRVPVLVASAFEEGSRTQGVGFVVDISAQKKAEREARERAQEVETIFGSMTDAFYALDPDWRFVHLNAEAERLLRRSRDELLGRVVWDEFPEAATARFGGEYRRAVREGVPVTVEEFYPPLDTWFEVRAFPSKARAGTGAKAAAGLSVYFRNVTERKRAEGERDRVLDALRESGERLRLALASGGMGTWEADLVAGTLAFSDEIPPLYGRPRSAVTIPVSEWADVWLHPDERERVPEAFAATLRGEAEYDVQFRTLWPDGETFRWVATRALVTRDAHGTPVRAVGYTRDVTEEHEREVEREAMLAEQRRLVAELREAGARQRRFLKDMLAGFTEGRLRLCFTEAELPAPIPPLSDPIPLSDTTLRPLRRRLEAVAGGLKLAKGRTQEFITAVHEAAVNAVRYAGGGTARIHGDADTGTLQVRVLDQGPGIAEEMIHRAVEKGYTTQGFGHGMFYMQSCADRLYLLSETGRGTTVVLEIDRQAPEPAWLTR